MTHRDAAGDHTERRRPRLDRLDRPERLSVIEHDGGSRLRAYGLGAHSSIDTLAEQAHRHRPRFVALTCPEASASVNGQFAGSGSEILRGRDGLLRMVTDESTDKVLSAIVGAAGLEGTWAAIEAGKTVALANKETLVVAGPLIMELARSRGVDLLPVDSEHSAIFQALRAGKPNEVRRVILTSSGGPVPRQVRARAGPRHAANRRSTTRPGGWGRRSRSTRPR